MVGEFNVRKMNRLNQNKDMTICYSLTGPLVPCYNLQMEKDVIQNTRLELEILEKSAQEKKFAEEKERNKEGARLSLIRGLDDQVK